MTGVTTDFLQAVKIPWQGLLLAMIKDKIEGQE
jgi:hypothetical protein